ncbi:unnamed protein product (macronuclear) [Paramecium tetraurelia]|uniref:Uncharacterized protein n=1 Tax=Paramecium tetraurelia TaxID=5888 RepID=A0EFK6_PARTE|nr:uncharacterized protein GSPATT00026420001 [Paramecium tetraurelia]CAK94097.1 unnamed protein product [Paramecium tetraurelia]|eukprot:XP_001461470.1 hypothetical protein (macronuclear) [Paramecium tetraurelia strain d4-2]
MSIIENEAILNDYMVKNLQKGKERENHSDFYDYNPLTSTYQCYGCQRQKPKQASLLLANQKSKKKRRTLETYKMNDIIIKPWHPFLREFQKIFKNSIIPQHKQLNYQVEYHKPDVVLQFYEIIRRLREQLEDNVKSIQKGDISVAPILETLAIYSIDEIEINYETLHNSTKSIQQDSTKKSLASSSIRYQMQEKKIQHYKEQWEIVKEQVELLEQNNTIGLKQQIENTIKAQKEIQYLKSILKETQDHLMIIERDKEQLIRENYFLFQYAQLDRHYLLIKIMEQYPVEQLKETDVSYFEIYLKEQEKELARLKLENTKLKIHSNHLEKESEVIKKESFSQFSNEFQTQEQKWSNEKIHLEKTLDQLKQELEISQRFEKELRILNQTMQEEQDKLRKQLFDYQAGMNNISHQHLIQRQQNDQLLKQNQELQLTIQQLEQQAIGNKQQFNKMNPNDQAQQLALIILSKERPTQEQVNLLRQVFGDFTDEIIKNQVEQNQNEQAQELIEQMQDLRNFKEKLESHNRLTNKQMDEIRKELEFAFQMNESQQSQSKIGRKLNYDIQDSTSYFQSLVRINEILNSQEEDLQKFNRLKSQPPQIMKQEISQLHCLLLLQALSLEEMIVNSEQNQIEDFSDQEIRSSNGKEQQPSEFQPIDEESSQNDQDEDVEESSIHQPEPYQEQENQRK